MESNPYRLTRPPFLYRFLVAVAMAPGEHGSRSPPPPPITTLLTDDLELFEVVLSWARGDVPPVGAFDATAAEAAVKKGRQVVRAQMTRADPARKVPRVASAGPASKANKTLRDDVNTSGAAAAAAEPSPPLPPQSALHSVEQPAVAVAVGAAADNSALGTVRPAATEAVVDAAAPVTAPGGGQGAAKSAADRAAEAKAAAATELRAHATGLVSATLLSRQAVDFIVSKGFAADMVRRLREGPVANHLRAEALRAGNMGTSAGARANSQPRPEPVAGERSSITGHEVGAGGVGEAPGVTVRGYGRWSSMAGMEAEHVAACLCGVGGYQEVRAPPKGARNMFAMCVLLLLVVN